MKTKLLFHYISYLQYPFMIIAIFFVFKLYLDGSANDQESTDFFLSNINRVLIFIGLGISFSTLQDTAKTQNQISKRVWEDPKKGRIAIFVISIMVLFLIISGLVGYFNTNDTALRDLCLGIIIMGIALVGLLKSAIEMFENNRRDKNITS